MIYLDIKEVNVVRILMLGPPGAGKGTQAQFVCEHFDIPQIATGDMLRAAIHEGSELGQKVQAIMDRGELVDDETIIELVKQRIQHDDCQNGFLLDGFPRTIPQAEACEAHGLHLDYVVEVSVPDEVIVERLCGRRVHPGSGRTFHITHSPPKSAGVDDETGEPLVQREDDQEEVVKKRLRVYHEQTAPLVNFYQQLSKAGQTQFIKVDGTQSLEAVKQAILQQLQS